MEWKGGGGLPPPCCVHAVGGVTVFGVYWDKRQLSVSRGKDEGASAIGMASTCGHGSGMFFNCTGKNE